MKNIIVYESTHHGNTKKLVDAIAAKYDVRTVDLDQATSIDLLECDCIGIASGIAYGKFYPAIEKFVAECLPEGKKVFFLYTCGNDNKRYINSVTAAAEKRGCSVLGSYGCRGFDTFGPLKLIGGMAKGHPSDDEIAGAVRFYEEEIAKS